MHQCPHLLLLLKTVLLLVLSLLAVSLPLVLFLFISQLDGILMLLIVNLGQSARAGVIANMLDSCLMSLPTAINSFTSVLAILIGCRTTIISTAVIGLVFVFIIVCTPLLSIRGHLYILSSELLLFGLLMLYATLLKTKREDKFVWATYYNNKDQHDDCQAISEPV